MNTWTGTGRLTADPSVKYANTGTSIARFTVACDRRFKKEGQPDADFINCLAFGKTAEFVEKYFKKGMKAELVGSIQTGSYTNKDGQKVYTTDILIEQIGFAESKRANEAQPSGRPSTKQADGFMNVPDGFEEEGLPF